MALDLTQNCLVYTDSVALFKIRNETVYGSPDQDRNEAAEVLIAAHITVSSIEEFVTVDSSPFLTKIEYDINNSTDGHYHIERLRFQKHSVGPTYIPEVKDSNGIITTYASLVYYESANKFYKNIQGTSSVLPDDINGTDFWEEILDFNLSEIRLNTTIEVGVTEILYQGRGRICVKNENLKLVAGDCACLDDLQKMLPLFKREILLIGARARAKNQTYNGAEVITRYLDKFCKTC